MLSAKQVYPTDFFHCFGIRLTVDVPIEQQNGVYQAMDYLQAEEIAVGDFIVQSLLTAAEQAYFWTPEWQEKEREADADLADGRFETFDSVDAMLDFLDAQ